MLPRLNFCKLSVVLSEFTCVGLRDVCVNKVSCS